MVQSYNNYLNQPMFTRKLKETQQTHSIQYSPQKKVKTILKPISKNFLRKLTKNRLKGIEIKRDRMIEIKQKQVREDDLLGLIDPNKSQCPICLQIAIGPIVLRCGHSYCLKCFEQNSIFNLRCCLCRLDIDVEEIKPAHMLQKFIVRHILPTTDQEISYWCRKGEYMEWEGRRRIDLSVLRVGDYIDVRCEDNIWRRGIITYFKFQQNQYCIETKICINSKIEHVLIPTTSRKLASTGFFTKGQYLKYRTTNYQSKFLESIQIPQIKCQFVEKEMDVIMEEKIGYEEIYEMNNNNLALDLFQYQMREWQNVFQLD